MRIYAHWLDGEYRKALTGVDVNRPWAPEDETAVRLLKTIALFGGTFVLSDPQLVDSPVLWKQFADNGFRKFIQSEPDYLELIVRPVTRGADARWSMATAGLERAMLAGRIASPVFDGKGVISFFEEILKTGPGVDFDEVLRKRRGTLDAEALFGFTSLLKHFLYSRSRVAEPPGERKYHTLFSILDAALDSRWLAGQDRQQVEATVKLITDKIEDPDARLRRAKIYEALDFSIPTHVDAWKMIVQAWNVAAQKSVCETGGSIGNMPGSVPIGIFVDTPMDVMLRGAPTETTSIKRHVAALMPEIPIGWDPGQLTWEEILFIAEHEQAGEARLQVQKAISIGGAYETRHAVHEFARSVAPLVKGRVRLPIPSWIWMLGEVVAIFGGEAAPMLELAVVAGMESERILVRGLNKSRERLIAARVVESAEAVNLLKVND